MKHFALSVLVAATAAIGTDELQFVNYAARFNKAYENVEEFTARSESFKHWDRIISEHNSTNGTNFTLGHNQFSDWTDDEYEAILRWVGPKIEIDTRNVKVSDNDFDDPPSSFNWVDKGFNTPVKDQGRCGACWAFSATGALEGAHFADTNELLSFSEQQLIDCSVGIHALIDEDDSDYDLCVNKGCHGGNQVSAFKYFVDNDTHPMLEGDYPYTSGAAGDDSTDCLYSASKATDVTVYDWSYN